MKIHNPQKLEDFYNHEKTNVAIITDIFEPSVGGVENVTQNLCNAYNKNGLCNIALITGNAKGYEDKEDFLIIRTKSIKIPKKWGESQPVPNLDKKFKKLLEKMNIDVFHVHTVYGLASFAKKFAKKHNIPIVFHAHSKFSEEMPTIIKSKLISNIVIKRNYKFANNTDKIIAVSNGTKQNYLSHKVTKPEISIIPNTSNFELNTNENEIFEYFKTKYNIEKNIPILLFVGRLEMKCKNLDFLFNSLKILKEKNFDFKMLIVGGGTDEENLKTLSKNLGLEQNIIFAGKITDKNLLSKYYYFADLFCFPSTVDNCPVVKFEAASQKTPILAIKNSASCENVVDNCNGYSCELNEEDYAHKIIEIFSDKQKLTKVSENAFKTLNVGWNNVSKQILEIFDEVIKSKKDKK